MGSGKIIPKIRNGQSFIEYGMLIIIVSAALVAMTTYIVRAMNARLDTTNNTASTATAPST